jgi:hypothetical protein
MTGEAFFKDSCGQTRLYFQTGKAFLQDKVSNPSTHVKLSFIGDRFSSRTGEAFYRDRYGFPPDRCASQTLKQKLPFAQVKLFLATSGTDGAFLGSRKRTACFSVMSIAGIKPLFSCRRNVLFGSAEGNMFFSDAGGVSLMPSW